MLVRVNDVRISIMNETPLAEFAAKKLGLRKKDIISCKVLRRAIDARRKTNICLVYHLLLEIEGEERENKALLSLGNVSLWQEEREKPFLYGKETLKDRPVIIGAGPAGLICAYVLASHGYRPLLLERGKPVAQRLNDVYRFWQSGIFEADSNVQFGEGGAGTFSDGKLTTRVNDPAMRQILEIFVKAGAPPEILTEQKPHVGTDKLRIMVTGLTAGIRNSGGEVRYEQCVTDLVTEDDKICGVVVKSYEHIKSNAVVLACGHSARDTYAMLAGKKIAIEAKPFAIGLRIEHPQELIDKAQYGEFAGHKKLGPADYSLVFHDKDSGRTAYSFCMCPGGVVVAAASENGGVVTNGMSMHSRDSAVANSALVVNVGLADFGSGPLAGVEFQRHYERLAFLAGGGSYHAPAQSVSSFLRFEKPSLTPSLKATYKPGVVPCDLSQLLPPYVTATIRGGLEAFERKITGFAGGTGLLTGVETRTSAPIRILRDEIDRQSVTHKGLYPTGEGAGYAGGIMSAALDGYHAAHAVMRMYKPFL